MDIKPKFSSTLKKQMENDLHLIKEDIENILVTIKNKDCCILGEFEQINRKFAELQMSAASFYLNSYLSPFMDRYEVLTTAIEHLSRRKHGALIVIGRNDPVDSHMHSGISVGASLSYSLLESIFYPGSPLHDGAVFIHNNKIISAGNVLPLSQFYVGEKKLGTRHRAAIGLSEQTDAIVLVVSEETGKASFTMEGKIYPFHPGAIT
ncbi:sporulation-specific diadenylate cyclase CdaS [Heyndrickxia sp. NPDC080065]|uniref:sporulation-specific diadenylate cyclase CdaS n=1 Tax=Heyndrickxia sp. NPDC080065 TaxID=3390568 RepID=UPI003CFC47DE